MENYILFIFLISTVSKVESNTSAVDLMPLFTAPNSWKLCSFVVYWQQFFRPPAERVIVENEVGMALEALIAHCPSLQSLNLADLSMINDEWLLRIALAFPHLKCIDLTDCKNVGDIGLRNLVLNCPNLEVIQVQQTGITETSIDFIATQLDHLESFGFSVKEFVEEQTRAMAVEMFEATQRFADPSTMLDRDSIICLVISRALQNIRCSEATLDRLRWNSLKPPKFDLNDFVHAAGDEAAPLSALMERQQQQRAQPEGFHLE